jgi:tetraacyldisaccharide 4'-kinase
MRTLMTRIWRGEAKATRLLLFIPLLAVSGLYGLVLKYRERWWRQKAEMVDQAPVPVISVGNITVGGSGKTPVVERLAYKLQSRGYKPCIILRGYRRKKKGVFAVNISEDTHETAGDEAFMLAKRTRLPVIVAKKRIEAVLEAVSRFDSDVALLDDGYQVRNLKKDLEVLVLNASTPQNPDLFPLGPLREPLSAVERADILLVNKGEPDDTVRGLAAGIPLFQVSYRPLHLFCMRRDSIVHHGFLKDKRVLAFSGLGDNRPFFNLLRALGATVVNEVEFEDHHRYTAVDLQRLCSYGKVDMMVTTEKDAVKLEALDAPENLFYLAIEATIERENELIDLIVNRLKGEPCKTDC